MRLGWLAAAALGLLASCQSSARELNPDTTWLADLHAHPVPPTQLEATIEAGRNDAAPLAKGDQLLFELSITRGAQTTWPESVQGHPRALDRSPQRAVIRPRRSRSPHLG